MSELIDLVAPLEEEGAKATVLTWLKAVGDPVAKDEPVVELETDKVAVEVAAPAAGVLAELILPAEAEATRGDVLGRIRTGEATTAAEATAAPAAAKPAPRAADEPDLRLSPSVRRLVRESGLDPASVAGTGRGGRLTRADMAGAISQRQPAPAAGQTRRVPHDRMRRQIAEHMSRSVSVAPHVTAVFEADFTAILAHREAHKAAFAAAGAPLTLTAYIVAAAAKAMEAVPTVNSRWHDDDLEVFADVNIGVGTALGEKGLIVPVIRAAQTLSLEEIAARLADLTGRARAGKLAAADVQGGTFSISNHGVSGSLLAAPIIINQPQSAILGVGKLEKRVVVRKAAGTDAIQIRPMAYVSLTIDHRVIDAAQTNAWLAKFVEVLETWPAG
ncbi:MAG TPA: 2-oxo acid dehydrogenase subunit E2 [Caulobacteraceae bacterium]|jgi:2-oxoglutarate dehydrogenase E2 component (dihydrolipoamide succinyltransferase)